MSADAGSAFPGALRITFTPTLEEHLRARQEMGRVARIFDPRGLLPWLVAAGLLATLTQHVAGPDSTPWALGFVALNPPALFFMGIGLRASRDLGKPLTFELGALGIDVRQPRHRWQVPWGDVHAVDETPDFFLVATRRAVFYLPRRAIGGVEAEAEVRGMLARRAA